MGKVKAVPDGYSTVTPYCNVKDAAAAIDFYRKALGAEERFRMPGPDGKVMHAELQIGSSVFMLSEAMMKPPTHSAFMMYVDDADALFKRAVDAGCKVEIPMADMFWGDRMGTVSDRFGNSWSFATHKEDVPPDQMERRAAEAMKNMPRPPAR
jgi:PhnB protein